MNSWFESRTAGWAGTFVFAALFTAAAFAQMGGGMMGGGYGGGMMGGGGMIGPDGMMGSGNFMNGGMMNGSTMWSGVSAVGPDGSAYVIRRSAASSSRPVWGSRRAELLAISPKDGTPRLLASLEGAMVSQPVTGGDGRIFVTTSEMGMWWPGSDGSATNRKPALIIVTPGGQTRTVTIDADFVSAPRVADEGNGYVVYVVASQTGSRLAQAGAGAFLYGFSADGTQRFRVQLTQN